MSLKSSILERTLSVVTCIINISDKLISSRPSHMIIANTFKKTFVIKFVALQFYSIVLSLKQWQ